MASAGPNGSHDITIADADGSTNKFGFMLYRGRSGPRPYTVEDARALMPAPISASADLKGVSNLGEYSVAWQQKWHQSDFSGGMGGSLARLHPTKVAVTAEATISNAGRLTAARDRITPAVNGSAQEIYSTGFAVSGTDVWAFVGSDVFKWSYADTDWDVGTAPDADLNGTTDYHRNGVEYAGRTYAPTWNQANDSPVRYIHKAAADAHWGRIDTAGNNTASNSPKYLAVADGKLWGAYWLTDKHHVRSTTDPTASANWASATEVGTSESEITGLISDGNRLLVAKTNGIWALYPDGSARNLLPEYEVMQHPHHFRNSLSWNGHVLLPLGWGGLLDLYQGQLYNISFKFTAPAETTFHGTIIGTAADAEYVYIMLLSATSNQENIVRGRFMGFMDGQPIWQWFHISTNALSSKTNIYTPNMMFEGLPSAALIHRRVWLGTGSMEAGYPSFIPDDEDVQDARHTSTTVGFETVVFDASAPDLEKIFVSLDTKTINVTSSNTIDVLYRLDRKAEEGGTYTSLGALNSENDTLTFPAGVTGKLIQLIFQWTSDASAPEELVEWTLTYYLRPGQKETFPLVLHLSDQQRLRNGAKGGLPKDELAQLRTWTGQADRVALVDTEGNSQNCMFIPGSLRVKEVTKEPGRRPEYAVSALLAEI
jgi:hypothetical protein